MQPPAWPDEDYWEKVRRLAKPLLASCLTTVAGFLLLLLSELPFIRQLGVFVGSRPAERAGVGRSSISLRSESLPGGPHVSQRPGCRPGSAAASALASSPPGLSRFRDWRCMKWNDDIRELEDPLARTSRARTLESERSSASTTDQTVYLTYGGRPLRRPAPRCSSFESWLHRRRRAHARHLGLGRSCRPGEASRPGRRFEGRTPSSPGSSRGAGRSGRFDPGAFSPFFEAYARHAARAAEDTDLEPAIRRPAERSSSGPSGLLLHTGQPAKLVCDDRPGAPTEAPPAGHTHGAAPTSSSRSTGSSAATGSPRCG